MIATSSMIRKPALRSAHIAAALLCAALSLVPQSARAAEFAKPTPEELSMTSLPGYPGAAAVILYREAITKDDMHSVEYYERLKVLTEEGKKYANVELGYFSSLGSYYDNGDNKTLEGIIGRTIHPDGTVIPFTGKPYLKVLEKGNGYRVQQKVFTLPDVEVGSIIEYKYVTRINDNIFEAPIWIIQDDLFVKEAHFAWWPTNHTLIDEDEKPINSITWFPILPAGAKIDNQLLPGSTLTGPRRVYELHIKDVPPRVREEYMPPIRSFSYRVNFAFSPYSNRQEYWTAVGKQWSKRFNSFSNSGQIKGATDKIIEGASTPEEKLRKIYAAVMKLENTEFTRERDSREDKAAGVGQVKNASDVLTVGRGTPYQLTALFVGMARAAGLQAYAMRVPDREETIFLPDWMDTRQFSATVAIVSYDGKDHFFDPGSRYCPFEQIAWQHTLVGGLRQIDGGTALSQTPAPAYKLNRVTRVANLTLTPEGEIDGKIDTTYTGAPAVHWRQVALEGDEESLHRDLRHNIQDILPKSMEVEVAEIKNISEYDQPLVVSYKVKGSLGTSMGKRMMVPADVFVATTPAIFPHETRELAVYFHYPEIVQDAVRINYPPQFAIEAVPASAKYDLSKVGAYVIDLKSGPNSVTARRDFALGEVLVPRDSYKDLRSFYSQMETKDQEGVVLKPASASASATTPAGGSQ